MSCRTLDSVADLREFLKNRRQDGARIGAVPTMGALHEGHLSLVREAARGADEVVVTIFVNPTQFGPHEDFERYPRTLERDTELAAGAGATVIFAPPVDEMYPAGEQTRVRVTELSQGLCGTSRPGHFEGVATVVAKLFNVVGSARYVFGKKDYQQWRLIERMATDLLFPVDVVGAPIVREADGLAMSSRNTYLSSEERHRALLISRGLQKALDAYREGVRLSESLRELVVQEMGQGVEIDYVETRDPVTLSEISGEFSEELLIAVAGNVGVTRLLDNMVLEPGAEDLVRGDS